MCMFKNAPLYVVGLNSVVSAFECSNSEAQSFKLFPNMQNTFMSYIYTNDHTREIGRMEMYTLTARE